MHSIDSLVALGSTLYTIVTAILYNGMTIFNNDNDNDNEQFIQTNIMQYMTWKKRTILGKLL